MTCGEIAELFEAARVAWVEADIANDGPPLEECRKATEGTMTLSVRLHRENLVGRAMEDALASLAVILAECRRVSNPAAEFAHALTLTQQAFDEAWKLTKS